MIMDVVINAEQPAPPQGVQYGSCYTHLLTCLGYEPNQAPVADMLRQYHGLSGEWSVVSPIHWQATHNDAMIRACGSMLGLSDAQSRLWFNALSDSLHDAPFVLHYHDANTWLIQSNIPHPISALPVYTLLQQSLMSHLTSLDSTGFWPRFITENQMFFSQHPLNNDRGEEDPINGVWVWGAGQLHQKTKKSIICFDEFSVTIAQLLSTQVIRYQPGLRIDAAALLLCLDRSSSEFFSKDSQLTQQLTRYTVQYYWNNVTQTTPATPWWTRIGRIFCAH